MHSFHAYILSKLNHSNNHLFL